MVSLNTVLINGYMYICSTTYQIVNNFLGEDIYILTGRMHFFEAFLLKRGMEKKIEIKPNSRKKNEFGLALPTNRTEETDVGMRVFDADLFDAHQVTKGKKIVIDVQNNQRIVSLITVDEKKHQLKMTRTKTFKESELITLKNWLCWIVPGFPDSIS